MMTLTHILALPITAAVTYALTQAKRGFDANARWQVSCREQEKAFREGVRYQRWHDRRRMDTVKRVAWQRGAGLGRQPRFETRLDSKRQVAAGN